MLTKLLKLHDINAFPMSQIPRFPCNIFSFVFKRLPLSAGKSARCERDRAILVVAIWVERNTFVIPVYEGSIEDAPDPARIRQTEPVAGRTSSAWFDEPCSHAEPSGACRAPIEAIAAHRSASRISAAAEAGV
jgi:hypothetical protein